MAPACPLMAPACPARRRHRHWRQSPVPGGHGGCGRSRETNVTDYFAVLLPDGRPVPARRWRRDLRRFLPPAPRHRPDGDRRVGRLLRRRPRRPRQDAGPVPAHEAAGAGPGEPGRASRPPCPRPTSTPSRPTRSRGSPGTSDIERRIRAYIRWNAAIMVVRANHARRGHRRPPGHLRLARPACTRSASTTSSGARPTAQAGDQVFFQGHAAPGIYARAFLEGRLSEDQLDHFRMELAGRGRRLRRACPSYPHPRLMPDFWEFPTVSMGLGPLNAIYQAHFNRYLHNRRIADTSRSRVWCFVGDGECDEPETLGALSLAGPGTARQPDLRRQLQPAAPRRPGAGQRQDHPGAGGRLPGRRLERHQGDLGQPVGRAAGPGRRRRPAQQDEHHRRRRVPEVRHRGRRLHPGALLRPRPPAAEAGRAPLRRRPAHACPAAATTTASCTPPTRRPPRRPASPRSSWPRRSRAGRSGPRSRPATPPTRSRR